MITALEQQVQDRLNRLEPILAEISEIEHMLDQLRRDDEDDEFHQRIWNFGHVVMLMDGMCTPRLEVAFGVLLRLFNLNHHEHDDVEAEQADDAAPPTVLH
jgi:hypothetical protein